MVEVAPGVPLLLRASWQPGPRESRPALLIVHGLGGSDRSSYMVSTGRYAHARGWHVIRMNMRGSGDGEALCPLLYNAGLDGDLLGAISAVSRAGAEDRAGRLLARRQPRAADARPPARDAAEIAPGRRRRLGAGRPRDLRRGAREPRQRRLPALLHADARRGLQAPPRGAAGPVRRRPRARPAHGARVRRPHHGPVRRLRERRAVLRALERGPLARRRSIAPRCCWPRPTTR